MTQKHGFSNSSTRGETWVTHDMGQQLKTEKDLSFHCVVFWSDVLAVVGRVELVHWLGWQKIIVWIRTTKNDWSVIIMQQGVTGYECKHVKNRTKTKIDGSLIIWQGVTFTDYKSKSVTFLPPPTMEASSGNVHWVPTKENILKRFLSRCSTNEFF